MAEVKRRRQSYNRRWMSASRMVQSASQHRSSRSSDSDMSDGANDLPVMPAAELMSDTGNNGHIVDMEDFNHHETHRPSLNNVMSRPSENCDSCDNAVHSDNGDYSDNGDASDNTSNTAFVDNGQIVDINDFNWDTIDNHEPIISDSDSDLNDDDPSLASDMAAWVTSYGIKHNAVDALLKTLKTHGHTDLPSTARTLLNTVKEVELELKSGMEYIYLGLKKGLVSNISKYPLHTQQNLTEIPLSFNIDGLPLFKSRNLSLWPILCAILIKPVHVFPVALCLGTSKPADLHFIDDTIHELDVILQDGIDIDGSAVPVLLKCIICDAPARAMVKCIKLYSGYFGCDRCTQKGQWFGRMTFQETRNLILRTDVSFRNKTCEGHHKGDTPFTNSENIDMIKHFPIDYMHQACLGVMKRLLLIWLRGKRETRISAMQAQGISERLLVLKESIPACFARKPRSLSEIDHWKATEYRQFMLYTGKLVLKEFLPPDLYEHFMSFSVAMDILVSPYLVEHHANYAHGLLQYFVEKGRILYGVEFMVYNVHTMLHMTADAQEHGSLDNCAAFPFENYLQQVKRYVRSGVNPLAQIVKRLSEMDKTTNIKDRDYISVTTKKPNNAYIIKRANGSSTCCEVVGKFPGQIESFMCRVYDNPQPLFQVPCDSTLIGAFKCNDRNTHMEAIDSDTLQNNKAIMIDLNQRFAVVFLAILHLF